MARRPRRRRHRSRPIAVPDLRELVRPRHHEWLANESELGGNPAMALVSLLRDGLRDRAPTPPGGCTAA